ncbi:MAG: T9SS type A sorting domain-containing protein, partial [Cytophagaceae bacterium]
NGGSVRFYQSTRPYLDRNLSITVAQQPTGPYNLRYFFQNAELNALIAQPGSGVTSVFDLVMTKNSDPCASAIGSTNAGTFHSPTGFGSLAGDRFLDFTGLTSFSSFYLHGGFGPLPVTLLSFEAQRTGKSNLVSWSTSQETNTDHFILERSTDGQNFTAIQRVAASGNSTISRSYSFLDREPARGYNYYRLQIVDRDNTAKFSGIRSVRNEGAADIALYPNPVVSSVNVSINADKAGRATIVISDLSGKQLSATNNNLLEGANIVPVNVSKLAAGTYIIKIQLNGDMVVRKFDKL